MILNSCLFSEISFITTIFLYDPVWLFPQQDVEAGTIYLPLFIGRKIKVERG